MSIAAAACARMLGYSCRMCVSCRTATGWLPCPSEARRIIPLRQRPALTHSFTGDTCPECGNMNVIRAGTCSLCLDCGTTSGCS